MSNATTAGEEIIERSSLLNLGILFLVFLLGAIIRHIAELTHIPIPYTVFMFGLGMGAGTLPMKKMLELGPHAMLNIFMPILIFEGAFAMDVYVFRKVIWQALILAGPGLVLMIAMTAGVIKIVIPKDEWTWNICMLFGAILSATDPVAVVALLKELGVSKQLSLLIEGESLLNDGTAMVAFAVLIDIITGKTGADAKTIITVFVRFAVAGPLFGYLIAHISIFWLSRTFNDPLSEIAVTLAAAYITFYVGETMLHVSGVLALVVLGITLSNNRTSISPEVEKFLHSFWETLAYMANTLIFFLVGLIIVRSVIKIVELSDFFYLALIYVSVNVIRGLVLTFFGPIMAHIGYGLPWQYIIIGTWSGLRGAVGLALALIVSDIDDPKIPKDEVGYKILFHLSGVVFLTLVLNATTVSKLLAVLGMSGISNARRTAMASALKYLAEVKAKTISVWRVDRFLADVDWNMVDRMCQIENPFSAATTPEEEDIIMRTSRWGMCPECNALVPYQPTIKEMADLRNDAIRRYIKAEKLSYWRQFEQGMLSQDAVRILMELCEIAADSKGSFVNLDQIKETWKQTFWSEMLFFLDRQDMTHREMLPQVVDVGDLSVSPLKLKTTRHTSYSRRVLDFKDLIIHPLFVAAVALILFLVLDTPMIIVALAEEMYDLPGVDWIAIMIVNMVILFLIAAYCLVRVLVLKVVYVRSVWFSLSIALIVIGTIDIIVLFVVPPIKTVDGHQPTIVREVFICLRFIRVLHSLEALIPLMLLVLEKLIKKTLSSGYDVGRGFVLGEDEARNLVDHMSEYAEITHILRSRCDDAKLDILKALGLLQKQYPEVAMSVKTRQAIRSVLNDLRQCIHTLQQEGVLEETEGKELESTIETKMKRLLTAPPKVTLPSIAKILQNVPWIENNSELVRFIKSRGQLINYVHGQTMIEQGEETSGILIILSGMVKLELQLDEGTKILDFLTSGNVLGEMGVLTNKRRAATVKSETAVLVLDLNKKDVEEAFEIFSSMDPPLKTRLWRLMAIRLSTGLFMDLPAFQGLTKERIRLRLESGYIHEVTDPSGGFTISSSMADVVLIHGRAYDSFTQEKFEGPCYIPLGVMKLKFEPDQIPKPVLFILPSDLPIYRDLDQDKRRRTTKNQVSSKGYPESSMASSVDHSRRRQSVMWSVGQGSLKSTRMEALQMRASTTETRSVNEVRSLASVFPGSFALKNRVSPAGISTAPVSQDASALGKHVPDDSLPDTTVLDLPSIPVIGAGVEEDNMATQKTSDQQNQGGPRTSSDGLRRLSLGSSSLSPYPSSNPRSSWNLPPLTETLLSPKESHCDAETPLPTKTVVSGTCHASSDTSLTRMRTRTPSYEQPACSSSANHSLEDPAKTAVSVDRIPVVRTEQTTTGTPMTETRGWDSTKEAQDSDHVAMKAEQTRTGSSGVHSSTLSAQSSLAPDAKPADTTVLLTSEKSDDRCLLPAADTDVSRSSHNNHSKEKHANYEVKPSHTLDTNFWGSEAKHLPNRDSRSYVDSGATLLHSSYAKPTQEKDAHISQVGPSSASDGGLPQRSNVKFSQPLDFTVPKASCDSVRKTPETHFPKQGEAPKPPKTQDPEPPNARSPKTSDAQASKPLDVMVPKASGVQFQGVEVLKPSDDQILKLPDNKVSKSVAHAPKMSHDQAAKPGERDAPGPKHHVTPRKVSDSPASADDWQLRPSATSSGAPPQSDAIKRSLSGSHNGDGGERGSGMAARGIASEEQEANHTLPRQAGVSFNRKGSLGARTQPAEPCAECGHVHPPGKTCISDPNNF